MPVNVVQSLKKRGRRVDVAHPLGGGVNIVTIDPRKKYTAAAASRGATGVLAF
jgi:hypothetical protein